MNLQLFIFGLLLGFSMLSTVSSLLLWPPLTADLLFNLLHVSPRSDS